MSELVSDNETVARDPKHTSVLRPENWLRPAVLASAVFYFILNPDLTTARQRVVLAVILGLGAFILIVLSARRSRQVSFAALGVGAGILIVVAGSSLRAEYPRLAWEHGLPVLAGAAAIVLAASGLVGRRDIERSLLYVAAVSAAVGVWRLGASVAEWSSTIRAVDASREWPATLPVTLPRVFVGGSHPNAVAPLLAVGMTIAVVRFIRARGRRRWASAALVLITAAGLVATGSRGAILGAVAGVTASILMLPSKGRRESLTRRWSAAAGAVSLVAGLAAYVAGWRPGFIFRGTLADRFPVMEAGLEMAADRLWLGNGPGAFTWLVDSYLDVYPGGFQRTVWTHPHNGFVQLMVEFGIVGAAVAVGAIGVVFWCILRVGRTDASTTIVGGLVVFAIHALVDRPWWGVAPGMVAGALVGLALRRSSENRDEQREKERRIGAMVLTIAVLAPVPLTVAATTAPALEYERGVRALSGGDWPSALALFERAADGDALPEYRSVAELARLRVSAGATYSAPVPLLAGRYPVGGGVALSRAIVGVGNGSVSREQLEALADSAWADEVALVQLGFLFDRLGVARQAEETWRAAVKVNPALISSPFWDSVTAGPERRAALLGRLTAEDPCGAWEEHAVLDGLLVERESGHSPCPSDSHTSWAYLWAGGESDELKSRSEARLASVPDDAGARRFAGLAALLVGDISGARVQLAIGAMLGDTRSALELARTYDAGSVPGPVRALVRSRLGQGSPVVEGVMVEPVYVLGALRTQVVDLRTPIPSRVVPGEWQEAVTLVHRRLGEAVGGW